MRQASASLEVDTDGQGLVDITKAVRQWVACQHMRDGLLTLFCPHTSASLLIQENASPDARADLERFFARIAPEGDDYAHSEEGSDDMPAHLRAALTQSQLSVPIMGGRMALGQWQGIYLFEHRRNGHMRTIALHVIGT